jgi:ZIP family zinc transporter
VSGADITLLGAIAGCTIVLGLPIGRLRANLPRLRSALNAVAIGILLFLVWDVLSHAWKRIDGTLGDHRWAAGLEYGLVLAVGLTAGLAGLAHYDRWAASRRTRAARAAGPGTASVTQLSRVRRSAAGEIALMMAIGIGVHDFAEGLSIGNAAGGAVPPVALLVAGFALHNVIGGFGIVAPLAAQGERPSWSRLLLLGLIGGGPAFAGTLAGQILVSDTVSVAFLGLAAGSILYVITELLAVARRMASKEVTACCVALGMLLGFGTDAVVTAAAV